MYDLIKGLALPPTNLFAVIAAGYLLRRTWRRLGTALIVTGFGLLYLLSTGFVSTHLLALLERGIDEPQAGAPPPQAIAILSAGYLDLEPSGDAVTVDAMTLERLRFGVELHRISGLPILVTGGGEDEAGKPPVGRLMEDSLRRDFGIESRWVEDRSATTRENATLSARILLPLGIRSLWVVTQSWHLPRALAAFRAAGFTAWPAAAGYTNPGEFEFTPATLLPSAKALLRSYYAFHEAIGLVWYKLFLFG
jgi:uncharacterized SAM-binding protein YcdF (DUF218 family)